MKQLSIFVENKPGRVNKITKVLENSDINILALTVADTSDYGILRLLVSNPEAAIESLKAEGFSVKLTDVIAVQADNIKGYLNKILTTLSEVTISVEYMYAYSDETVAAIILKTDDQQKSTEVLVEKGFKLL